MVRAMPASAAVWVAVLLLAGFPAAAMTLPVGFGGSSGFGEGGTSSRVMLEGMGLGGRLAHAARRLAPTKPGCMVIERGSGSDRVSASRDDGLPAGLDEPALGLVIRVEHLNLPPPGRL